MSAEQLQVWRPGRLAAAVSQGRHWAVPAWRVGSKSLDSCLNLWLQCCLPHSDSSVTCKAHCHSIILCKCVTAVQEHMTLMTACVSSTEWTTCKVGHWRWGSRLQPLAAGKGFQGWMIYWLKQDELSKLALILLCTDLFVVMSLLFGIWYCGVLGYISSSLAKLHFLCRKSGSDR